MKRGGTNTREKNVASFSDTSSESSASFDVAVAEQYLTILASPWHTVRTPVKAKLRPKKLQRQRFTRTRSTRLMLLDESSDINSDATSTSSEDYEVVAQLIRRRPRTKIPSAPSDSETSDGASDDGDAGVVFFVPGGRRPARSSQSEPPRKLCLDGLIDILLDLAES
ncbi:hypothetical protein GL50803_0010978 [Giardia duodenalis]|uniref:Uncharacterized protein n=1 Tax=Giardia intestinalis (strain ATCC 50803 / WB clone C6) TaxID=184922 RepID=A8BBE0_GIAIC|nr:hypothetical protein GL50803_0010978 [Giardia intestinalis]KAE8302027.1 hypothetical protein GL50803_0010978 [Giardia intestinalis]|eukprot:XP_001708271.1 Hypothetical protein GL50803_10978 [Giardia lamblia ATCC 50803]